MPACEKCCEDARQEAYYSDKSTADVYEEILADRSIHHCTLKEQAGQYWDESRQRDRRYDEILKRALSKEDSEQKRHK